MTLPTDEMTDRRSPQAEAMEAKYGFPYHHLAYDDGGTWRCSRNLSWGLEYLGYLDVVVSEVLSRSPRRVLDVGCGDGKRVYELVRRGIPEVTGVDVDERAVMFAGAFSHGTGARLLCGDIREMPDDGFELATMIEVIEHIPDEDIPGIVEAVHARTVPGATLIVTVPTTNVPVTPVHYRHYTPELLASHLGEHFTIERTQYLVRGGLMSALLPRVIANSLFIVNHTAVLRLVTSLYRWRLQKASQRDGKHLLAICRRNDT